MPVAKPKKTGRPSLYSEALAEAICRRVMDGESLRAICSAPGMPRRQTVHGWLNDNVDFLRRYNGAIAIRADDVFDDIARIEQAVEAEAIRPDAARVIIDARKWRLARMSPRKYGDRQEIEHTGADGGPLMLLWTAPEGTGGDK